jgi:DNA-binding MarR family transcriptional regulator
MKPAPVSLEPTIAALARIVEVVLERETLTIQKYRALSYLVGNPASPSELARRLIVQPPVITRLIDGLVAQGLVERRRDESDHRRSSLVVTRSGAAALRRADAAIQTAMDHVGSELNGEERRRARQGIMLWGKAMRKYYWNQHAADPF